MHWLKSLTSRNTALAAALFGLPLAESLAAQDAGDVMTRMNAEQRISYINGMVEGLAIARWIQDRPDSSGMNCIYDWYYQKPLAPQFNLIRDFFERNPDQRPGALLHVLLNKECPGQ